MNKIVEQARTWIDTKFIHQGRSKKTNKASGAVDCIGLLIGVSQELNIPSKLGGFIHEYDEPNYSRLAIGNRLLDIVETHLDKIDKIEEGAIVIIRFASVAQHVGIISRKNDTWYIIHGYAGADKVVEHELKTPWLSRIMGIYRFKDF